MKDLRNSDGDQWSPNCTTFSDPPHPDRLLGRGNTTPTRKHPATPRARSTISIRYCHDHTRGWLIHGIKFSTPLFDRFGRSHIPPS